MSKFQRIIVPTDFSEESLKALHYAVEFVGTLLAARFCSFMSSSRRSTPRCLSLGPLARTTRCTTTSFGLVPTAWRSW